MSVPNLSIAEKDSVQVSIRARVDLWAILRLEGLQMYTIEILMKRCLTYEKCNFHFTINYFNHSNSYIPGVLMRYWYSRGAASEALKAQDHRQTGAVPNI